MTKINTSLNISRWLKCIERFLLVSSNWNNSSKARVRYTNSNNVAAKSNRNNSTRLELMTMSLVMNSILTSTKKLVEYTAKPGRIVLVSSENALFSRLDFLQAP